MRLTKKNIIILGIFAVCIMALITGIALKVKGRGGKQQNNTWYVQQGLENDWAKILRDLPAPNLFSEIQTWNGTDIPAGPGILISTQPWQHQEKVSVYYRLSFDLEYQGAIVLALDPWMIFRKHFNPPLSLSRAMSDTGENGALLIAGSNTEVVSAWAGRLLQTGPGQFPFDEGSWHNCEQNLFTGNRFPRGSQTYTWQDVFFRLMGNELTWVYAPLSEIRRYRDHRKAILEAAAFPEDWAGTQYSLQASILWALPIGSDREKENLSQTITWLKKPETQTIIADTLEWIPADPYGIPYDPISLTSHRNWLIASYIYEIHE